MNGYLAKPLSRQTLLAAISQFMPAGSGTQPNAESRSPAIAPCQPEPPP
jgi:hypothetical protein